MKIIDRKIIQRYYDKNKKTHNQLNNKVIESNEDLDNNIKINKIYINDIKNYKEYTIEDFEMRTGNDKLKEKFFLLFAPLM